VRSDPIAKTVERLRALSRRGLASMYRRDRRLFGFTVRRRGDRNELEGVSRRYTAITLIGLARDDAGAAAGILAGAKPRAVWDGLAAGADDDTNLGDVALTLWSGVALGCTHLDGIVRRLTHLDPVGGSHPTVEVAWALTALTVDTDFHAQHEGLARRIADRLLASFSPDSGLFPHWPVGAGRSWLRGHVACFADVVYPTQALSHYFARTSDDQALAAAQTCADHAVGHQGPGGQWWWHFDVRTGRVVEGYPVYSVHQDAMAPMALLAVQGASGRDYSRAIARGVQWLLDPPELADRSGGADAALVDDRASLIWRKVSRREPNKLARSMQALASRIHPAARMPGVNTLMPPQRIDFECRPYHLGWLLYAWSDHKPDS